MLGSCGGAPSMLGSCGGGGAPSMPGSCGGAPIPGGMACPMFCELGSSIGASPSF